MKDRIINAAALLGFFTGILCVQDYLGVFSARAVLPAVLRIEAMPAPAHKPFGRELLGCQGRRANWLWDEWCGGA